MRIQAQKSFKALEVLVDAHDVTLEWLEANLEGFEWNERRKKGEAYCPCHDDVGTTHKGLSISLEDGQWLVYCHSCHATLSAVLEARNGTSFSPSVRKRKKEEKEEEKRVPGMTWWVAKTGVAREVWESLGCYESGKGVAFTFATTEQVKLRRPPKEMNWTHEDLDCPPLWPFPEDDLPEHVMLTEGESDCGTAHAAGLPFAFSITKGAGGALPPGWADALRTRGAREITICGDADDPGQRFSERATAEALDAQLLVNVVHIDSIVDPFRGVTDLNSLWRLCDTQKEFLDAFAKATRRVSSQIDALTYADMEEIAEEEMEWIVGELISPGDKVLLSGPQKAFKTWIMLDLARAIADKGAFLSQRLWAGKERRKVLIVEEEGSKHAFARRIRRMELSDEARGNLLLYHRKGVKFTEKDRISTVIALCREEKIDVVFFDPLQRMIPGVNENDASETAIVWDEVQRIQEALPQIVVVIVHHAGKSERLTWESIRGSSRHGGEVDLGIFCEKAPLAHDTVKIHIDGRDVHLEMEDGWGLEGKVKITDNSFSIDVSQVDMEELLPSIRGKKNTEEILKAVGEGHVTRQEIADATGLTLNTVIGKIKHLIQEGILEETGEGARGVKKYGFGKSNTDE